MKMTMTAIQLTPYNGNDATTYLLSGAHSKINLHTNELHALCIVLLFIKNKNTTESVDARLSTTTSPLFLPSSRRQSP